MLEIDQVSLDYGDAPAVKNVSLQVLSGEIVGIVGESGSGKSTLIRSILDIGSGNCHMTHGEIRFDGQKVDFCDKRQMKSLRGKDISMIFQNAEITMDPLCRIENIFLETLRCHKKTSRAASREIAIETLRNLMLPEPEKILKSYPFELSGGMCQRVAIGIAMLHTPKLLLADEPTSALDVTVQNQVMELMLKMRETKNTAILIVSHNMGVIAKMADKVGVMYHGELIEWGSKEDVLYHPKEDYTKHLIKCVPKMLNGGQS